MPFDAPKVYSDEMLMFSGRWLGHPLWYPEPDSNGEVRIGDVGCIFQGRFRRLFNVLEARGADQPQPKGFEPLGYNMEQGVDRRLRYLAPGTHAGKTVTVIHGRVKGKATILGQAFASKCEFQSTSTRGAVLHLKGHAHSESVITLDPWQSYAKKHSSSWAPFVKSNLGFEPKNLILVTGHVKCSHWAVVAFEKKDRTADGYIKAGFDFASGKFAFKLTEERSMFSSHMSGPNQRSRFQIPKKDQCLFLSGIVGKRRFPAARLWGGALSEDDSSSNEDIDTPTPISENAETPEEDVSRIWKGAFVDYYSVVPVKQLTKFAQWSNANFAIASDKELDLLLGSDASAESDTVQEVTLSNMAMYLRNKRFPIDVEDGVGTLSLISLVQHTQDRRERLRSQHLRQCGVKARRRDMEAERSTLEKIVLADGRTFRWLDTIFGLGEVTDGNGHAFPSFSISGDGELILTSSHADGIILWNCRTGAFVRRFPITDASLVALSPDGAQFVSASRSSAAMIWSTQHAKGTELRDLPEHEMAFMAYSPDGGAIAIAAAREAARLWTPEGVLRHTLAFDGQANAMRFSADGTLLVIAADATAYLWHCENGKLFVSLRGHGAPITSVAFSCHSDHLATGSEDRTARVWNTRTGDEVVKIEHATRVLAVDFSPVDQAFVSGCFDGSITVNSHSVGGWMRILEIGTERRSGAVHSIAYSHDGRFIVSGDAQGLVKLWDTKQGSFIAEFHGHEGEVRSVTWSPDDSHVLSSSGDGAIRAWNIDDVLKFL
ncbi:hypothetical protein EIP86_009452 [Pleurotus ostreatoroseus]|nr:hypothetical protein EIP86_009452 [Pleurotus ostreatoroseus]